MIEVMFATETLPAPVHVEPAAPETGLRRVLYVILMDPSQKFGSLEEQIFLLARAFRDRSSLFAPLFICRPDARTLAQYRAEDLHVHFLDLRRFRWSTLWQLLGLIRHQRIEVVHWNFSSPLANAYLWFLTVLAPQVKHYFTDHNSRFLPIPQGGSFPKRLLKKVLLKRYHKVLCVSHFVRECLQQQRAWSNLLCCTHFINTDRFKPDASIRAELRGKLNVADRFVVLTVAHLTKAKGVEVLLRAMPELPPDIVLWVIGGGEEAEALRQLCQRLALGDRVQFLGLQKHVQPYMQAADCFVCPSLWAEAAGLVNLEAQACGLPVVASRIGGIPEYVEDEKTGLLFSPGDHEQLASCIRRLYSESALCQEMGRQARDTAIERFSVESKIQGYLDLYRTPAV